MAGTSGATNRTLTQTTAKRKEMLQGEPRIHQLTLCWALLCMIASVTIVAVSTIITIVTTMIIINVKIIIIIMIIILIIAIMIKVFGALPFSKSEHRSAGTEGALKKACTHG